jgi:hypothetical protein
MGYAIGILLISAVVFAALLFILWKDQEDSDKEIASLNENVQWLRKTELARGVSPPKHDTTSHVVTKIEHRDLRTGLYPRDYDFRQEEPVSSCSAKERITEMRLKALETGQPIDTMELVTEAISALERSRTNSRPYFSTGTGMADHYKLLWEFEIENERKALALLRFAVERATPQEGDVTLVRESL